MRLTKLVLVAICALLCTSCVVKKSKYEMAESGRLAAIYSRDSLQDLLGQSRMQCATLMNDTLNLGKSLRNYQALLNSNLNENQKLTAELAQRIKELNEHEATINQLQGVINDQNAKVQSILDNVKNALQGFSSDELTVREEGGKVYVAMSDKLLFESGKAVVNEQGRAALGKLADVLNKQTEVDVYIEGHTDSVPIKTAIYQDNWDLSVIRATSVVRILTETYNVQPLQIMPCGRGEWKPVDTNSTNEGRAHNRRTEIIIAPKLDKLYEMLKNN